MLRTMRCALLLVVCVTLGGCGGPKEEASYSVSGTVTLDGQPLAEGDISFILREKGDVVTLPVKGGSFSGKVRAGKRRVEISAYRLGKPAGAASGMTGGEYDQPTRENIIPAKYNVESTLTADVSASGPNQFKFDLVTGAAKPDAGAATPAPAEKKE